MKYFFLTTILCFFILSLNGFGQSYILSYSHHPEYYSNTINEKNWNLSMKGISVVKNKNLINSGLSIKQSIHLEFIFSRLNSLEWSVNSYQNEFVEYLMELGFSFIEKNKMHIKTGTLNNSDKKVSYHLPNNFLVIIVQLILKNNPEKGCNFISKIWEGYDLSTVEGNSYLENLRLGLVNVIEHFYEKNFISEISHNVLYGENGHLLPEQEKEILLNAYFRSKLNEISSQKEMINFSLKFLNQSYGIENMLNNRHIKKWSYLNRLLLNSEIAVDVNELIEISEKSNDLYEKYLLFQSACYLSSSKKIKVSKPILKKLKTKTNEFLNKSPYVALLDKRNLLKSSLLRLDDID